jgi:hypothetical protein
LISGIERSSIEGRNFSKKIKNLNFSQNLEELSEAQLNSKFFLLKEIKEA